MYGLAGNDRIYGGTGDDRIAGGDGNDVLFGGEGNDIIETGIGLNSVFGGAGDDIVTSNQGFFDDYISSVIHGDAGNDILKGSAGNDILFGDEGNDKLTGGSGDVMSGGTGNDHFSTSEKSTLTILDFGRGKDVLDLSGSSSFDELDSDGDGILSDSDTLLEVRDVSVGGSSVQSLVFLNYLSDSNQYVPALTLRGVTELGREEVISNW